MPVVVALLAVLLVAPTLRGTWGFGDDLLHRDFLLSSTLPQALSRLFVFLDPGTNAAAMDLGTLPWWTLEGVRVAFWRPLAALSLWLDYQLWPHAAALMHAHSIVWYGGLCALAASLYRRLMGPGLAAGLAALLFAADVANVNSVASLASRNVLQTVSFALLTLLFHDRWREGGRRASAGLALFCLALALLSAEAGVATGAYLFAYALFLDQGTWRGRLGSLVPYAVLVFAWRLLYQSLGYGTWGADYYVDPGWEPLRFVGAILERGPLLLFGKWGIPDPAVYVALSPGARRVFWWLALSCVILVGALLVPLLRRDRVARFWGLGMALAVLPACGVSLFTGRHLFFVGLGAMGLVAQFIAGVLGRCDGLPQRRAWRGAAWLLLVLHVVLFPLLVYGAKTVVASHYGSVADIGPLPGVQDVVIVNAPSPAQFFYLPSLRNLHDQPMPAHLRLLSPAHSAIAVTRLDEHTLLVRPEHGYLLAPGAAVGAKQDVFPLAHAAFATRYSEGFIRSGAFPMPLGQRVELTGMRVQVTALTDDGRPLQARVQFELPLEDPALCWLQWDWAKNAYAPFKLPQVGETVWVPGPFIGGGTDGQTR
jgi:hypothetical protein